MFEIFWGIFNIVILTYFIVICLKSTKLIREKLGVFAALIFVFGLLSFIAAPTDKDSKTTSNKFEGNTHFISTKLEENLATEIELNVIFSQNQIDRKVISAKTSRSGFIYGANWNEKSVNVENSTKNNFIYEVSGIIEWKILGVKVYSEWKIFKGKIKLAQ